MKNKCLYCYKEIEPVEWGSPAAECGFHQSCSKKFFGSKIPPLLEFSEDQMLELAEQVIKSQKTITGVQPKLSLGVEKVLNQPDRFTIIGLWGDYILKPQTELYPNLPENEDLTMHLAQIARIKTVEHSLIRLKTGQLAYITKRVDRKKGLKLHMEDMCQLTERLTEHKYQGSYEQIAKVIKKYSVNPGLDLVNFYELVLFCFLTGNNDMHLKNFSLLKKKSEYSLCPAYDLLASELVVDGDDEELALHLNGKKKRIKKRDFEHAMGLSGIMPKVCENIFSGFAKIIPQWVHIIEDSFLPTSLKDDYKAMIMRKADQLDF